MAAYLSFADGPAKGETLLCQHAPTYLRVVRGLDGKIDCLDQPEDVPALGEEIFIYRAKRRMGHINGGRRDRSGFMIEYAQAPEIDPEGMEDWDAWQAAVEELAFEGT